MLISVKKRFIFIANSKTASTSIETALIPFAEINRVGSPQRKHISWQEARKEYNFLFNNPAYSPKNFFKFGVVREPVDWVVSWYNYRSGNDKIESTLPSNISFEEFWCSNDWVKKRTQKNHFLNVNGECIFDLIIPHEKVKKAFPSVVKYLKLGKVTLPHENSSPVKKIIRNDLDPKLISEINGYYQQDFDFWIKWNEKLDAFLEKLEL